VPHIFMMARASPDVGWRPTIFWLKIEAANSVAHLPATRQRVRHGRQDRRTFGNLGTEQCKSRGDVFQNTIAEIVYQVGYRVESGVS